MTKDNASGAGMELPPLGFWALALTTEQRGYVIAYAQLACTDATRLLAESQAHNAKLEAQVERLREALDVAKDALDHYQHGGSNYRVIAANALAKISAALKP